MTEIVLTTFNARFSHASLGLRCVWSNLGPWRAQARIVEFDLETRPEEALEAILSHQPRLIGCGVYVWNTEPVTRLAALLKRVRPGVVLVVGGPEAGEALDHHLLAELADHRVIGEGERVFREICAAVLTGGAPWPRRIVADEVDLSALVLPYEAYTDHDLAHRHVYVESSRGCPYRCAFCLSALDRVVRRFPLPLFLAGMERLVARGARQFKFVDRTFNLGEAHAGAVLDFFLERMALPGLFVHFELMPDRLTGGLLRRLAAFPAGRLQLEVGIQSFNAEVLSRMQRPADVARVEANLRRLLTGTRAHLHTDLIVGLPGEDLVSLAAGFDRLVAIGPHEIQVGILKRLAGTPLTDLPEAAAMVFDPSPPYELLLSPEFDFALLRRLKRFARYWDLVGNSGRFGCTLQQVFEGRSAFWTFLAFSDRVFAVTGQTHKIALPRLALLVQEGFAAVTGLPVAQVERMVDEDRRRWPRAAHQGHGETVPERQRRHLAGGVVAEWDQGR